MFSAPSGHSEKDKKFSVQLVQLYLKRNTSVPEKEDSFNQHVHQVKIKLYYIRCAFSNEKNNYLPFSF